MAGSIFLICTPKVHVEWWLRLIRLKAPRTAAQRPSSSSASDPQWLMVKGEGSTALTTITLRACATSRSRRISLCPLLAVSSSSQSKFSTTTGAPSGNFGTSNFSPQFASAASCRTLICTASPPARFGDQSSREDGSTSTLRTSLSISLSSSGELESGSRRSKRKILRVTSQNNSPMTAVTKSQVRTLEEAKTRLGGGMDLITRSLLRVPLGRSGTAQVLALSAPACSRSCKGFLSSSTHSHYLSDGRS